MAEMTPDEQAVIDAAVELVEARHAVVDWDVTAAQYPVLNQRAEEALIAAVERMQAVRHG